MSCCMIFNIRTKKWELGQCFAEALEIGESLLKKTHDEHIILESVLHLTWNEKKHKVDITELKDRTEIRKFTVTPKKPKRKK